VQKGRTLELSISYFIIFSGLVDYNQQGFIQLFQMFLKSVIMLFPDAK